MNKSCLIKVEGHSRHGGDCIKIISLASKGSIHEVKMAEDIIHYFVIEAFSIIIEMVLGKGVRESSHIC